MSHRGYTEGHGSVHRSLSIHGDTELFLRQFYGLLIFLTKEKQTKSLHRDLYSDKSLPFCIKVHCGLGTEPKFFTWLTALILVPDLYTMVAGPQTTAGMVSDSVLVTLLKV